MIDEGEAEGVVGNEEVVVVLEEELKVGVKVGVRVEVGVVVGVITGGTYAGVVGVHVGEGVEVVGSGVQDDDEVEYVVGSGVQVVEVVVEVQLVVVVGLLPLLYHHDP